MLTFRDLTPEDHDLVVPMVQVFYRSDAVDHPVDAAILERSFQDAASPAEPLLRGLLIQWEDKPAGYMYLTQCYSAEVGGRCVFLEEIFLKEEYRRRGLGAQVMAWLEQEYPAARRFRLEVTQANQGAVHFYQKAGYAFLRYEQMVLDKIK
ncbi:MAG: GNAT family N-acetyltransferase [Lawsonibacter sp.]|jgi:GNAT superfamily N-acetyltransferase|nr:GNAT family N-acetyltransferase [Lawsonibacter sp.]